MSGDVINLTYYEDSDLRRAPSYGGAALPLQREGAPESVLHADNIDWHRA